MTDNFVNKDMFPDMGTPDNPKSELEEWFWQYHADNPQVYEWVDHFSRELAEKGRDTYSITMVMGRIRWHTTVEASGDAFKINDHAAPYYARLWMRNNPEQKGLFRTRTLIGGYQTSFAA